MSLSFVWIAPAGVRRIDRGVFVLSPPYNPAVLASQITRLADGFLVLDSHFYFVHFVLSVWLSFCIKL
jgi:hypothetical protein